MNLSEFRKSLCAPQPVYLLMTGEDHLKRKVYETVRDQVDEGSRAFNWSVFDLKTERGAVEKEALSEFLKTARTLPWMAPRRWIYVKNADVALDALKEYIKNPADRSVVILELGKRPRGLSDLPTVEMPASGDPVRWIVARVKQEGYEIEPRAAEALVELVGEDYQQLEAELEKQILWAIESRMIRLDSVLQMTRQAREYDVFALINAIARGRSEEAMRILNRLFESGMSPPQILTMLYWNFRRVLVAKEMLDQGKPFRAILPELKIWSYKGREREIRSYRREMLEQLLCRLRETDRLCKTTATDARLHLERVVFDTCSAKSL